MGVNGIYGLSGSGLDIESMVKVGMMGKQSQLDKLQQKTDLATWKKEAMSSVYSDLSTMNYSTLSQYKLQSNMNAMSATSSDESIVKVTANGSAASMSHKVSVGGLSSNAYLITGNNGIHRNNESASKSISLADNLFSSTGELDTTVYKLDGVNYVGCEKGNTTTTSTFACANQGNYNNDYTLTLTKTVSGDGSSTTYSISPDDLHGYHTFTTEDMEALDNLSEGQTLTFNKRKYNSSGRTDSAVTDFTFTDMDGGKRNVTFAKNSDGTYTHNGQTIESDLSNLVVEDKLVIGGEIVSRNDVAVSFTVKDGAEDTSGMSEEEVAEFWNKRTITYTYGELLDGGKTYNDLAADINALGTNIKASYDTANDSFSLNNKKSGADNKIELQMNTAMAADLFNNLGLKQSKEGVLSDISSFTSGSSHTTAGSSGSITIDGKTYNNVEDNRITVDGVTYQLQNVSSSAESSDKYTVVGSDGTTVIGTVKETASAKTVNVVINQNTDAIIEKVKSFVEDYNKMLDGLYEKYSETKYTDYKPLTDSQRDKMTEKQAEKWEEKAKSGLLYHDYTIGKIIDRMRQAVSTPVEGLDSKYNSAYSIGIYTSKTNGHLSLDEDRLKKALAEDPEAAYKIFGTLPESDDKGNYDYDKMGVAQRLGDVMAQAMKDVKTEAGDSAEISDGSNLGNKIMEFQQKMSDFKTLMSAFETQLYKKYDAMESLLATLGAQMNYITGGQ